MLPADTPRLRFREMGPADLDAMAALLGDPDVMRFYPAPRSREESLAWIEGNRQRYAADGFGLWIIETHDGAFVGDCGLTWQRVNGERVLEVGYHVRADRQGSGFATEAAAACRDLARTGGVGGAPLADVLAAITHPDNRASQRVAEKIGMTRVADDLGASIPVRFVYAMPLA